MSAQYTLVLKVGEEEQEGREEIESKGSQHGKKTKIILLEQSKWDRDGEELHGVRENLRRAEAVAQWQSLCSPNADCSCPWRQTVEVAVGEIFIQYKPPTKAGAPSMSANGAGTTTMEAPFTSDGLGDDAHDGDNEVVEAKLWWRLWPPSASAAAAETATTTMASFWV
ncbi:hypothetical protein Cni_G15623 [Canna indica]|uniref:Uncharacterized protein n=1 Tax=Canna indica TaxID=4628 RepID=A0AAQ3KEQ7_9LILI|nr:hypothetical protein Cni_G15623 [Canna indica]